mmetsp:Transcript_49686/g.78636  ORF Transcript_49686/g.78636 Transcript_49686/m.78636 type:complete len:82 (-) Transcript_49686:270-515(-)
MLEDRRRVFVRFACGSDSFKPTNSVTDVNAAARSGMESCKNDEERDFETRDLVVCELVEGSFLGFGILDFEELDAEKRIAP